MCVCLKIFMVWESIFDLFINMTSMIIITFKVSTKIYELKPPIWILKWIVSSCKSDSSGQRDRGAITGGYIRRGKTILAFHSSTTSLHFNSTHFSGNYTPALFPTAAGLAYSTFPHSFSSGEKEGWLRISHPPIPPSRACKTSEHVSACTSLPGEVMSSL